MSGLIKTIVKITEPLYIKVSGLRIDEIKHFEIEIEILKLRLHMCSKVNISTLN